MAKLLLIAIIASVGNAFSPSFVRRRVSSLNCICINCKHVTNCGAYHFVEQKHQQPHICENPTFEPRDGSPTINVHIRPIAGREEVEEQMRREHKDEERNAKQSAEGSLVGETVYDMRPEMSLEYDVIACEDFVEDMGCWVRNMPEVIRLANPDFVPP